VDKKDKKAYIAYHRKHDRPASANYLPENSMSTANAGTLEGRFTTSSSHHPFHDEKYHRRDHHSNGLTMTPTEFKHYTIGEFAHLWLCCAVLCRACLSVTRLIHSLLCL
jgi:hypothetical protein